MEPERWKQIDWLLEHALEVPPEDRKGLPRRGLRRRSNSAPRSGKAAARGRACGGIF